jgi:predicted ABC-type ATPase
MSEANPSVIVLAGANGAGKTTAARSLLAETLNLMTFVNADVIAQGLAGFDPDAMAREAGRIMLQRLRSLAEKQVNFAFETTLAGRAYAPWLRSLRTGGYAVHLVYFWVGSADVAVLRVAERVSKGGHGIPEATIRQRFERGVRNFFNLYRPIVTSWAVYDNSRLGLPYLAAHGDETGAEVILLQETLNQMQAVLS